MKENIMREVKIEKVVLSIGGTGDLFWRKELNFLRYLPKENQRG